MKTSIKKFLEESKIEVEIEISKEEFENFLEGTIVELGRNLEAGGFRKGHLPREIVIQKIGKEKILEKASIKAIKEIWQRVVKESGLDVLGPPKIEILKLDFGKPLVFKVKTFILPEIALPDYKKIASEVKKREVSVKEKEVLETLKWIQKSRAKMSQKKGPCLLGDMVEIQYQSQEDKNPQKDNFILGEGYFIPEFEEKIKGMSQGEEKEFFVSFPQNYFRPDFAGRDIKFWVRVVSIKKIELPPIDDQWAKSLGNFNDLNELKESIKEGIKKEKEEIESQKRRKEILERISGATDIKIPQVLIDFEKERTIEDLKQKIPQVLRISFEEYLKKIKKTEEDLVRSLLPEIEKKIKNFLVLGEIRKREKIEAKEEEIVEEANKVLTQYRNVEEAQKAIDPKVLREYTKEKIENEKTLRFLENLATI
jgi:trigger factor